METRQSVIKDEESIKVSDVKLDWLEKKAEKRSLHKQIHELLPKILKDDNKRKEMILIFRKHAK